MNKKIKKMDYNIINFKAHINEQFIEQNGNQPRLHTYLLLHLAFQL